MTNITLEKNGAGIKIEGIDLGSGAKGREDLKAIMKIANKAIKDAVPPTPKAEYPVTLENGVKVIAPGVAVAADGSAITYNNKIYELPGAHEGENHEGEPSETRTVGFQPNPVSE